MHGTGQSWAWVNYPVRYSRYFDQRRRDGAWEQQSPRHKRAELHFSQTKEIRAKKVKASKDDPDLVTVAVDLNVKNLAVITVRQHGKIIRGKQVSTA
jgi:transposase